MSSIEKIRVLRIVNRFNLGGPTYNAAYLTKHLDSRFETKLIGGVKDVAEASSEYMLQQIDVEYAIIPEMKRKISWDDVHAYRKISKIIREFKPHIVHTHASKAGTLGRLAAFSNRVPVVVHTFHGHVFHSYFGRLKTAFYKAIERVLAKRSSAIVAISAQQKHEIGMEHRICAPEKIRVVPLGFDLNRFTENTAQKRAAFRAEYGLAPDDVAVCIVGRLTPVKNHRLFLDAAKTVAKAHKHVRFFIVGDGESRDGLLHHATSIGLAHVWQCPPTQAAPLCFTSWIRDVDYVYAGCDIVCLTSLNEGTPVSLIEAQAAQRPIVATRVGGIGDIVQENQSAFLCDSGDVEGMAARLSQLATDKNLRTSMGQFGQKAAIEKFSYTRLCRDMERLYVSLAAV